MMTPRALYSHEKFLNVKAVIYISVKAEIYISDTFIYTG